MLFLITQNQIILLQNLCNRLSSRTLPKTSSAFAKQFFPIFIDEQIQKMFPEGEGLSDN